MKHCVSGGLAVLALLFALPMNLAGQAGPLEREPTRIDLRVHPAVEPTPALKYTLLPEVIELKPGNAAVAYMKLAMLTNQDEALRELVEEVYDTSTALEDLPLDRMRQFLVTDWMDDLEDATHYADCDWQIEVKGVYTNWNYLSGMRYVSRCVSSRIRLHVATGDIDEALRWLRVGFTMAQHSARGEMLLSELVGLSITALMLENLEELLQHADAPSLYWALTTLPQPLFSLARAMRWERHMLYMTFPQLRHVRERGITADEWHDVMRQIQGLGMTEYRYVGNTIGAVLLYPEAKAALIASGYDPAEVEAMPVATAIGLHMVESYERNRDDITKLLGLPYWEAAPRVAALEAQIAGDEGASMADALTRAISPAVAPAMESFIFLERRIAALRIIEALRLHAGANGGALPASLDDVTIAPIPLDPMTGKPFVYRVEAGKAILELLGPPEMSAHRKIIYTIEIIK